MKITLESTEHDKNTLSGIKISASIEVGDDTMTVDRVIEELVRPVPVAYGFHPDSVKQFLPDDYEGQEPVYDLNDEEEMGKE